MTRGFLFLAVLVAACSPGGDETGATARHLLLVSIDTLRADHLGCYGYERPTSPWLDSLASRGTRFEFAISPAAWTVPAHVTMLTGLEPTSHGVLAYPKPGRLPSEDTTLAETLGNAGFRTAAFTGGGYMSRRHGLRQGFEVYETRGLRFRSKRDGLSGWLRSLAPDERFFVFLHGFDVHGPYEPPAPYGELFDDGYAGDFDVTTFSPEHERLDEETLAYVVSQYDGEIRGADAVLAEVTAELEELGLLDETLVVVTSDHGEEMYEHGTVEHTHSLYDEVVRVPLIFQGPGVPVAHVATPVALVDVVPSVLQLLGLAPPRALDGHSLFAEFPPKARPIFSSVEFRDFPYRLASVRTEEWKLIDWSLAGMASVDWSALERERYTWRFRDRHEDFAELYHLPTDPEERTDVSAEHPEVVAELRRLLDAHRADARLRPAFEEPEADAATLEALEALGYVDGE